VTKATVTGTVLAVTTYAYDGDGARVRKDDPDGTTLYIGATEAVIGAPGTTAIEYYDDTQAGTFNFLNYTKTVVSATTGISYAWGVDPPLAGMGGAPWALRWNQWVSVAQAGLYTVTVIADDGVGLSIAGVSVIYSLAIRDTGPLTAGVGVSMVPGNLYQLQVSYLNYTSTNGASFRLRWTRPDGVTEDILAAALRARSRRDYFSFGGAVVAMKEGVAKDARVLTYLHGDHLGSVSLATNASGNVVSQQRYKPYGEVRWSSGAGMPTDFTFTGQRAGPANYVGSLTDYVARSYSPALGRFVSADTIVPGAGNPQTFNRYMYVLGNPLRFTDPTGHFCWPCLIFFVGVATSLTSDVTDSRIVKGERRGDEELSWLGPALMVAGAGGQALFPAIATHCAQGKCQLPPQAASSAAKLGPSIANTAERIAAAAMADGDPTNETTSAGSVVDKLQRYLLNPDHLTGGAKAKWFEQALGFTRKNLPDLARQVVFDKSVAIESEVTQYGTKYYQWHKIIGANGREIDVQAVWIITQDTIAKLVTMIPAEK
jgi:RHS repeat-associated protein